MASYSPKLRLVPLCLSLAVASLFTFTIEAAARTWYIKADGTGDAPTIQAGVDASSPGDVILVAAGTYAATSTVDIAGTPTIVCVAIGKDVSVVSESGPSLTTIGNATARVALYVHDTGSAVEVSGFRLQTLFHGYSCLTSTERLATIPPLSRPRGIKCVNASPKIWNNDISANDIGIELIGSSPLVKENIVSQAGIGLGCYSGTDAAITKNTIHNCGEGIHGESSTIQINENDIYACCEALYCASASSVVFSNNKVHEIDYVAVDCGNSQIHIEDNAFTDTNLAISLGAMTGATDVRGNIFHNQISGAVALSDNANAQITIESNTINLTTHGAAIFCQALSSPAIKRNIIVNSLTGIRCILSSTPTLECNDVFATQTLYAGDCGDQTGLNGNISLDPQFCGIPGTRNYSLQADSPCATGNHPAGSDCGGIGALGVGCGAVSVKAVTWGAVKSFYGQKE
jgi:hypothetical protein